jgi:hypothetical protein
MANEFGARSADSHATVIIRPPRSRRRIGLGMLAGAALALVALAGGVGWWLLAPPPVPAVPLATEAQIAAHTDPHTTVFRFAANPRILVIDFGSLREQGLALNRVAAFAEKAGQPHDRALGTAALEAAIAASGATVETYYYGHDYSASELVSFFGLADRDHVSLLPEEEALRALLGRQGLLSGKDPGALITLVQPSADGVDAFTRRVTLRHELSHGEFFANPAYAAFVRRFWAEALTIDERAAFRRFLAGYGYDAGIEELMLNEMQAFLMFTPDQRYFSAGWLAASPDEVEALRRRFLATMPAGWLRDTAAAPLPRRRRRRQRSVTTRMTCADRLAGGRSARAARRAARYSAADSVSGRGVANSRSCVASATTRSVPGSVAVP